MFGMGTGVAPPLESPGKTCARPPFPAAGRLKTANSRRKNPIHGSDEAEIRNDYATDQGQECCDQAERPISTG